jgi:hypothetical protein
MKLRFGSQLLALHEYLTRVREKCYADMERDKDLEDVLLEYYNKNKSNTSFKIE